MSVGGFGQRTTTCHLARTDVYFQLNNSAYDKAFSKFAFYFFLIKVSWRICLTMVDMYGGVKRLFAPHNIFGGGRSIWW